VCRRPLDPRISCDVTGRRNPVASMGKVSKHNEGCGGGARGETHWPPLAPNRVCRGRHVRARGRGRGGVRWNEREAGARVGGRRGEGR